MFSFSTMNPQALYQSQFYAPKRPSSQIQALTFAIGQALQLSLLSFSMNEIKTQNTQTSVQQAQNVN